MCQHLRDCDTREDAILVGAAAAIACVIRARVEPIDAHAFLVDGMCERHRLNAEHFMDQWLPNRSFKGIFTDDSFAGETTFRGIFR